jgi:hypothetical protein
MVYKKSGDMVYTLKVKIRKSISNRESGDNRLMARNLCLAKSQGREAFILALAFSQAEVNYRRAIVIFNQVCGALSR